MISFGETFQQLQQCFNEQSVIDSLGHKLDSVTIIRDIKGKIRLFLQPLKNISIAESETTDLNTSLSTKLGRYYGNDIWLPVKKDGYKALIDTIKAERVVAPWDDESVCLAGIFLSVTLLNRHGRIRT